MPGMVIQPALPVRQLALKTRFPGGLMAGQYLNLFATVSQDVLKGLGLRSASNLTVTVRNAKKAYDLPVTCEGGLAVGCGSLVFQGKSDQAWNDTLEWAAYDASGKLLARTLAVPSVSAQEQDTNAALLWASAERRFSEKKELPEGPVYGFVDEWASLLSLPKDSVSPALAAFYADNGVPRIVNISLKDVIPNYEEGQVVNNPNNPPVDPWNPNNPNNPITTALAAKLGVFADPSAWKVERMQGGMLIRIQGLAAGLGTVVELYDLAGKLAGAWAPRSEAGALNLSSATVRPGIYLLKIRIAGKISAKRIVF
jgi:hypothetical protein